MTGDFASDDVLSARLALAEGLESLRTHMIELWSASTGNLARTGSRSRPNQAPTRHGSTPDTRNNSRGGVTGRPVAPVQGGRPGRTDTAEPTVELENAVDLLAGGGEPGSQAPYPDRPDPSDAAAEVWALVER